MIISSLSTALIFLFYLAFYGFLAGMFSLTMWVMLQTLDDHTPKYRDRVANPGLMIRPKSLDIEFNRSIPLQYTKYVQHLEVFLQKYNDSLQENNVACPQGMYYEQDDVEEKKVCQFKRSVLRQCSGLADSTFGYSEGQPCVLVKMNRVIGLKPRGDPHILCSAKGDCLDMLPNSCSLAVFHFTIALECLCRDPEDPDELVFGCECCEASLLLLRETPLQMQYFPDEGALDKSYFPYYGKKRHGGYVQPVVAVKLLLGEDDYNTELTVECKVEGSDLLNNDDRDKFLGRVTFRVNVHK
ncbi:hypothetical protein DNTS_006361 [Danionella cerebrum]|uniref:Sodium/potassium-transporting ATPase subunit beta n=1 Tax=Danionella cerebrum TaxID=2873325 RepID=A0A553Q5J8_9TELE|nr:hypothetical protein DNTS_006361 [Danionella translucida]